MDSCVFLFSVMYVRMWCRDKEPHTPEPPVWIKQRSNGDIRQYL